ncbi:secreted RxLR effector protein 161-like [Prosopis cineraria]|uniref:secreted RxLR effector protein 161-like n=1 Tax=Prosopis cineraria TaxID=364024 RepID=UPI00241046AD|nr:secreted RxLR effector protein 161-like [Prosopis cineraria]
MAGGKILSANEGALLKDPTDYRSALGTLQYLTNTRPDISFAVNHLSQFLSKPTTEHWKGVKRIFRYLKGTSQFGLSITPSQLLNITAYADANWAACPDDRRSVSGYCTYLGGSLVSWCSKKQSVVSRSSTESEYRALSNIAAELACINAAALVENPVYHARTKHIEIDVHYVCDQVLAGKLKIKYVPSNEQNANFFTKPLYRAQFVYLRDKLKIQSLPSRLRGVLRI